MKTRRVLLAIICSLPLLSLLPSSVHADEVHYALQRGKQSVYAMPNAPRMERFWLDATLNKAQGLLTAVWGYEKGGGQDGAQISMTKQGDKWVGQGKNWAGNAVVFEVTPESITYQWGPRLDGGPAHSMLGQIVWSIR